MVWDLSKVTQQTEQNSGLSDFSLSEYRLSTCCRWGALLSLGSQPRTR